MKILIATNNKSKQKEFAQILTQPDLELVFPEDVGLADLDVDESGDTFARNAWLKAREFAKLSGLLSVSDDSGLEVDALGGEPGIHSKRFATGTTEEKCQKIIALLENEENRKAQFRNVLVLVDPSKGIASSLEDHSPELIFETIFEGQIAREMSGNEGFGFDSIFIPKGESETVAKLGQEYKNKHSHRAQSIMKLAKYLENQSHS